ncbi:hypothetical protein F5141DRAFT_187409 [Pisolithus sp. B1]|nr:hypothetical protein F5141DRAFT_187409 [Pisolithus sp. B1]
MLYGITILAYVYYMHYSEDTFTIKLLVAAIWTLNTLHVSFMCHVLYHYLITNYGKSNSLNYLIWSLPASVLMDIFMISAIQCFFVHQIYCLCRPRVKWLVTAPIMLFVLAQFGLGIGTTVLELINHGRGVLKQITYYDVTPAWAIIVVAEVLITVSLCVVFYGSSSGPVFSRTKRLLNTLIIYAVNRCLLTSLVAIADLVVTNEVKDTWAIGLNFILGKLYANSFLASLNSREHLRSKAAGTPSDLCISTICFADPPKLPRDAERSKHGARQFDVPKMAVVDVSTNPLDQNAALRREGEV